MNLKGRLLRLEAARSARTNEIWPKILPFLENAARPGASADIRARAFQISKILRTIAHRAPLGHGAIAVAEKLCAYFDDSDIMKSPWRAAVSFSVSLAAVVK